MLFSVQFIFTWDKKNKLPIFIIGSPKKVLLTKKVPKIGNRCYYIHSIAFKSNLGSQFQNRMVTHKTFTQSNEITLEMTYNNPKYI